MMLSKPLKLAGDTLQFVDSVKYLGVSVFAGKHFRCSVNHLILKFFCVFNCTYSKSSACKYENAIMELVKRYCLPFVLYATETVTLSVCQYPSVSRQLH